MAAVRTRKDGLGFGCSSRADRWPVARLTGAVTIVLSAVLAALLAAASACGAAVAQSFDSLSCARSGSFCVAVSPTGSAMSYERHKWSRPVLVDAGAESGASELDGVSCGSVSRCLAFDSGSEDIFTDRGGIWSALTAIDPDGGGFQAISCASASACLAVDYAGQALRYNGSTWSAPGPAYTAGTVASLSCATAAFCVAGDDLGNVVEGAGGAWGAPTPIATGDIPVDALSCPTRVACVAAAGSELVSYRAGAWAKPRLVGGAGVTALGCASASMCLAVDGGMLAGGRGRWKRVPTQLTGPRPGLVSCSESWCIVLDGSGSAVRDERGVWSELAALPGGTAFRPAGVLSVGRARTAGPIARIRVRCSAADCRLALNVDRGPTVLGARRLRLAAGLRTTLKLALGARGRRALRQRRSLPLELVVSEVGLGTVLHREIVFTS